MYEALPVATGRADTQAQLNAQGARGFRYVSGYTFGSEQVAVYVKDSDPTYGYELQDEPDLGNDVNLQLTNYATWMNTHGARGYTWAGPTFVGSQPVLILRKDLSSSATFSYRAQGTSNVSDDVLAQFQNQGNEGYYPIGAFYSPNSYSGGIATVFQKDSQSASTYDFEILDAAGSAQGFMDQLNAQGARGYRFRSEFVFGGVTKAVFEKGLSQSAHFVFEQQPSANTSATFLTKANALGADGTALMGGLVLPGGESPTLYYTATDCSGLLCDVRSLFGF